MYSYISPKTASKYLRDIDDTSRHLRTKDKQNLTNLFDLYFFIRNSDEDIFRHHVSGDRNHVSEWVREVILDDELAKRLDTCLVRHPMQHRLLLRINFLVSSLEKRPSGVREAIMILDENLAPEHLFITAEGRELSSLWELYVFLKEIDYAEFRQYVDVAGHRNEIADWVDDYLHDHALANRLKRNTLKREMIESIGRRIVMLEKRKIKDPIPDFYFEKSVNAIRR